MLTKNCERRFECEICGHRSKTQRHLNLHTTIHSKRKHVCKYCDYETYKKTALINHNLTHVDERPFVCNFSGCKVSFAHKSSLSYHLSTHSENKPFVCNLCCKEFRQNVLLERHIRTHIREKPYKCTIQGCDYSCTTADYLTIHLRMHSGEKPFKCNFQTCQYSCTSSGGLTKHKRKHFDEKRFKCDYLGCDYSSILSSRMDIHKRKHSGEKPYSCAFKNCNFSCADPSTLTKHKRKHSGEKPYKCDHVGCDYASAQSFPLKLHKRKHSIVCKFKCDHKDCPFSCMQYSKLKLHKQTHAREKPFCCLKCPFSAATLSEMKSHFNHHHQPNVSARTLGSNRSDRLQSIIKSQDQKRASISPEADSKLLQNNYKSRESDSDKREKPNRFRIIANDSKLRNPPSVLIIDVFKDIETLNLHAPHLIERNISNKVPEDLNANESRNEETDLETKHKAIKDPLIPLIAPSMTDIEILQELNCNTPTKLNEVNNESININIDTGKYSSINDFEEEELKIVEETKKEKRICKICAFETKKLKKFQMHLKEHREKKEFFCSFCDFICLSEKLLKIHWRTHIGESEMEYSQGKCCSGFEPVSELDKRPGSANSIIPPSSPSNTEEKEVARIKVETSKLCYQQNEKKMPADFIERMQVYKHYTVLEYSTSKKRGSNIYFSCNFCRKEFRKEMTVLNHLRHHTGQKLPVDLLPFD